ncbi:MAG: ribonucleoside-triphosphate reductase, adenosylcobalamin-dependent [Gemmatimonadetes bacterium]|nr:ribonucleoside-triphosphate reductase, adenosylcobalamin-dependent [Gemmatimonadota bacterium]
MPEWGPIGREVYERTYSRRTAAGGRETWPETVARTVDGNLALAGGGEPGEREALVEMIESFQAVPAGRHLWVSGVPGKQYLFNCHRAGWSGGLGEHAAFLFDALMVGGGVGADYTSVPETRYKQVELEIVCNHRHHDARDVAGLPTAPAGYPAVVAHDSREGWVQTLAALVSAHVHGPGAIAIDLSHIRQAGDPLKRFGGTASGPAPLAGMLREVNAVLNRQRVGMLDYMEIDHAIASCVVAGNVRRSARMSIVRWDAPGVMDFIKCKSDDGAHWSTNISVGVDDAFWLSCASGQEHANRVLGAVAEGMAANGEPGLYNLSLAAVGERGDVSSTNPCGEIPLEEWEPCNLGHINLGIRDGIPHRERARLMARFLVRATMSPDVHELQRPVLERNRRIGVGLYGVHEWMLSMGVAYSAVEHLGSARRRLDKMLRALYADVRAAARSYCDELGLPAPVKYTTIAPTGTISLLSGHTAGAHPVLARHFLRRVRYADTDPALEAYPPAMVEPCAWSKNTSVVSMLCEDPLAAKYGRLVEDAHDLTISEQLAVQDLLQDAWADNAVSYTVALPQAAPPGEVRTALLEYGPRLKGLTMFPALSRHQQPIERLTQEQYDQMSAKLRAVTAQAEDACVGAACPVR